MDLRQLDILTEAMERQTGCHPCVHVFKIMERKRVKVEGREVRSRSELHQPQCLREDFSTDPGGGQPGGARQPGGDSAALGSDRVHDLIAPAPVTCSPRLSVCFNLAMSVTLSAQFMVPLLPIS